ncbi:Mannose-6-phosphate isomerase, cupin superfamily [Halogranum rubrum]|nr:MULTISPECIES: cupin domain-containing protein [Halogranum]SFK73323.1 Mannose-6-phosphate isomerase, cupin superfamily [Halogranum rubrum]
MERVPLDAVESTEAVPGVHLAQLAAGEQMSVQHFHIEAGEDVPVHSHHHEQTGYIVEGELTFLVGDDGEEVVVGPGDSYAIAADEVHGAENRGDVDVKGVDIFSPPRTNPDWQE